MRTLNILIVSFEMYFKFHLKVHTKFATLWQTSLCWFIWGAAMPWAVHKTKESVHLSLEDREERDSCTPLRASQPSSLGVTHADHFCDFWQWGESAQERQKVGERRKDTSQGGDHSPSVIAREWGSSVDKPVCADFIGDFLAFWIFPRDYRTWGVSVPFIRKEGSRVYWR